MEEHEGFSTYMAILCEAYGTTGYYVRYTDDFCLDIGFTLNLKEEEGNRTIIPLLAKYLNFIDLVS